MVIIDKRIINIILFLLLVYFLTLCYNKRRLGGNSMDALDEAQNLVRGKHNVLKKAIHLIKHHLYIKRQMKDFKIFLIS